MAPPSSSTGRQSRPATSTTTNVSSQMRKYQAQAQDCEQEFEQLEMSRVHGEEDVQKVRASLCHVLSEMILEDPKTSCDLDCDQRLWRRCFYSRIQRYRSLISRERRHRNASGEQQAQKHFETVLREALELYNYLSQNLQGQMTGNVSHTQSSYSQSQEEEDSYIPGETQRSKESLVPESKEGIVEMVHYLYIRIGDLNRYQRFFSQAIAAYENAIRLVPGSGTPYNQVAVVNQSTENPQNVISLYWYARAVLATNDPDVNAFNNAELLLEENHEKMMENHGRDELSSTQQQHLQLHEKTPKPIQTKQFLGEFVDLHRIFLLANKDGAQKEEKKKRGGRGSSVAKSKTSSQHQQLPQQHSILDAIEQVMERFQTLLAVSAFSDSLLLKMICIHAFSEAHLGSLEANERGQAKSHRRKVRSRRLAARTATWLLARTSTYNLGSCIANKILKAWNATRKQQEMQSRKNNNKPSTRLLVPLLLLSEYLFYSPDLSEEQNGISDSEERVSQKEHHDRVRKEFWKTSSMIWNLASQQYDVSLDECDDNDLPVPEAYNSLVGYGPFAHFIRREPHSNSMETDDVFPDGSTGKGFISDEEACALFNTPSFQILSQSQMSQEAHHSQSQTAHGETSKAAKSNPQLVSRRLLRVARKIADSTEPNWMRHVVYTVDGELLEWKDDMLTTGEAIGKGGSAMDVDEDHGKEREENGADDDGDNYIPPDDDDAGDEVLVYQEGAQGGPPLLVPGAMVGSPVPAFAPAPAAAAAAPATEPYKEDVDMDHILPPSEKKKPPPVPPPGFGPPPAPPGFGGVGSSDLPSATPGNGGLFPSAHLQHPESSVYGAAADGGPTIGSVFASMALEPTQNPFANQQTYPLPFASPQVPQSTLNAGPSALTFLQPPSGNHDQGVSLLESDLLHSLWMDDSNKAKPSNGGHSAITKNPFLQST